MTHRSLVLALVSSLSPARDGAGAQQQSQPDWPCRQVRVPNSRSAASGPARRSTSRMKHWREDQRSPTWSSASSDRVAPRWTRPEQLIAQFANAAGDRRKERLTMLFAGVYERMNDERRDVVNGLDRFGRRLKDMAEKAREETQTLRDLQDRKPARPRSDQEGERSAAMAFSALRGAAAHGRLCVRKPGADRAAFRRARAHHPAGDGISGGTRLIRLFGVSSRQANGLTGNPEAIGESLALLWIPDRFATGEASGMTAPALNRNRALLARLGLALLDRMPRLLPGVGAGRIPQHIGIAERERAFRRVP